MIQDELRISDSSLDEVTPLATPEPATLVLAGSAILSPPEPDLFASNWAQSLHFLVALVSKILVVVSLLMMAAQRLQAEVEARNAELDAARAMDSRARRLACVRAIQSARGIDGAARPVGRVRVTPSE